MTIRLHPRAFQVLQVVVEVLQCNFEKRDVVIEQDVLELAASHPGKFRDSAHPQSSRLLKNYRPSRRRLDKAHLNGGKQN